MNPKNFLNEAASLIDDRGTDYGGIEQNFALIAQLANSILKGDLDAYDIAIILHCVKLARIRTSPLKRDNYLDGVNYLAFAGELATGEVCLHSEPLTEAQMSMMFTGGDVPLTAQPQEQESTFDALTRILRT